MAPENRVLTWGDGSR